jgi:hypothetical protein
VQTGPEAKNGRDVLFKSNLNIVKEETAVEDAVPF